jgi:hypothetical protein
MLAGDRPRSVPSRLEHLDAWQRAPDYLASAIVVFALDVLIDAGWLSPRRIGCGMRQADQRLRDIRSHTRGTTRWGCCAAMRRGREDRSGVPRRSPRDPAEAIGYR